MSATNEFVKKLLTLVETGRLILTLSPNLSMALSRGLTRRRRKKRRQTKKPKKAEKRSLKLKAKSLLTTLIYGIALRNVSLSSMHLKTKASPQRKSRRFLLMNGAKNETNKRNLLRIFKNKPRPIR